MEEDTGKSLHVGDTGRLHGADRSLIDYNRCGIPLLEIVSRPDIHDPDTAQAYLRELQGIVRAVGVSDARMEEGSIRCDANVSVRRPGAELGTRCEIKNLNSVRSLGRAISYEAERQIAVLEDGGEIVMETRHWDEGRGVTETLRRKESVTDYRYFPDPDLVEVYAPAAWVDEQRARLPELPAAARSRLRDAGVSPEQAATIVGTSCSAGSTRRSPPEPTRAPSPTGSPARSRGSSRPQASTPPTAACTGVTSPSWSRWSTTARCRPSWRSRCSAGSSRRGAKGPKQVAEDEGLQQVSDEGELRRIVEDVVASNAGTVEAIRGGNDKAIGALVGQVMKATRGQADPRKTNELLREVIG
jgi:aspartyl-tRNA(Asn)/glutamyl-tRNA(Gln) amidotransferase subunit B